MSTELAKQKQVTVPWVINTLLKAHEGLQLFIDQWGGFYALSWGGDLFQKLWRVKVTKCNGNLSEH